MLLFGIFCWFMELLAGFWKFWSVLELFGVFWNFFLVFGTFIIIIINKLYSTQI